MNRRKFIETSGVAAGAAVLGGVNAGLQAKLAREYMGNIISGKT